MKFPISLRLVIEELASAIAGRVRSGTICWSQVDLICTCSIESCRRASVDLACRLVSHRNCPAAIKIECIL